MVWSVATVPGPMLSSTLSDMELDERGHLVRLIPSLSGKIYKLKDEMVEPIALDASSLLFSSLKMQENLVLTGGKETRTLGIDLKTGEVQYECGMTGECRQYGLSSPDTLKDVLVVQRVVQTVKAHVPRSGENKWNFSVSLHDVNLYPGVDLCEELDNMEDLDNETVDDIQLKAVVPEGILCASDSSKTEEILWRRKFQTPLVDVWRIRGNEPLEHLDMFSKNTVPKRSSLVDDDDDVGDDDSPELYIGIHKKQLYIQESILMHKSTDEAIRDYMLNPDNTEVSMPRVQWKPYLVSPSRTPYYDHGGDKPSVPLLTDEHTLHTDTITALAIMDNSAQYPYDAGYYLYSKKAEDEANFTTNHQVDVVEEPVNVWTPVEYVTTNIWFYWREIFLISILTAVMMNVLITRPIILRMRDNFQDRSRELAQQFLEKQNSLSNIQESHQAVIEKVVEVQVPQTPSTPSEPSFPTAGSEVTRQNSDFTSRFLSDFQPVQCLGRGGFGVVFECKNKYDDIHYAVKRITLPASEESRRKVKREVKLHAKLEHRNVVRYFYTWEESPPAGWQVPININQSVLIIIYQSQPSVLIVCYCQDECDAQLNIDMDNIGSVAQTTEQSATDTSFSLRRDQQIEERKLNKDKRFNPLRPFQGFSQAGFSESSPQANDSFSIAFENSTSDNKVPDNIKHSKASTSETTIDTEESEIDEESSGGIVFEQSGRADEVSVDIHTGDSSPRSCVEALDWDLSRAEQSTVIEEKQKSFMYIVMQLCRKETLRDWLRINPSRSGDFKTEVYNIFHQICSGVDYVHQQGLVHRDLKPSNIYFSTDGVIKIGDFGLVTDDTLGQVTAGGDHGHDPQHHHPRHQHTDQVGTLTYMSPEQLQRRPYSHKVDIYSMGLVFLELLVPFTTQV